MPLSIAFPIIMSLIVAFIFLCHENGELQKRIVKAEELLHESDETLLKTLADTLNEFGVRKRLNINNTGYSVVERTIIKNIKNQFNGKEESDGESKSEPN